MSDLAKELLEIEATGDRARAENWFKKYGVDAGGIAVFVEVGSQRAGGY